jgi:TolA-binding protein
MAGPTTTLAWAELFVALLAIAGTVYAVGRTTLSSVESGYIHKYVTEPRQKAKTAHEQVDAVESKVDNISEKIDKMADEQQKRTDAIIALGESMNNGREFDTGEFERQADDRSVDRFLDGDDD